MASSKPVVAANHLGPKEIIQDGKTGLLFEKDNLESLVRAAELAWNDPSLGLAGRELVVKEYDWNKIVPRIEEVYCS